MKVIHTELPEVLLLEPVVHGDARGYFMETYNQRVFEQLGLERAWVQDAQSRSAEAGTLRGLHYQLNPRAQAKIVRVLSGAIYDVAVDLRKGSPTFGRWAGVILSEANQRQLLVPRGWAHGFCTLAPDTQVFYKMDEFYARECERGILWEDPDLRIAWPVTHPLLSEKDRKHPRLVEAEINFEYPS